MSTWCELRGKDGISGKCGELWGSGLAKKSKELHVLGLGRCHRVVWEGKFEMAKVSTWGRWRHQELGTEKSREGDKS